MHNYFSSSPTELTDENKKPSVLLERQRRNEVDSEFALKWKIECIVGTQVNPLHFIQFLGFGFQRDFVASVGK